MSPRSALRVLHTAATVLSLSIVTTLPATAQPEAPQGRVDRFTIVGGIERGTNDQHGLFTGTDVALSPAWSVGYSATARFSHSFTPGAADVVSGATLRGVVVGYRPVRWFSAYAGPAVARATLDVMPLSDDRAASRRRERVRVNGGIAGAMLRLHDRPYRFYMLRAHLAWVPHQALVARRDWNLGAGIGLTF